MQSIMVCGAYILMQFLRIALGGLYDWFIALPRWLAETMLRLMRFLEEYLAFFVTMRNFWTPLYGEKTVRARALGIAFRFGRIFAAMVVYGFVIAVFASCIAALWIAPVLLMMYMRNL